MGAKQYKLDEPNKKKSYDFTDRKQNKTSSAITLNINGLRTLSKIFSLSIWI